MIVETVRCFVEDYKGDFAMTTVTLLVKVVMILYLRISQLCKSVQWPKNLLKLNM